MRNFFYEEEVSFDDWLYLTDGFAEAYYVSFEQLYSHSAFKCAADRTGMVFFGSRSWVIYLYRCQVKFHGMLKAARQ